MNENPLIARARELASGSTRFLDLPALEAMHGPEALRVFLIGWQRWRAIDKRRTVLFGHADNRHGTGAGERGTVGPDDMEETFLRFRYAHGEGWPRPAETRAAEVNAWLADEATPAQAALFRSLLDNPAALEPENVALAALLVHFAAMLEKLGRLPTRAELRATFPFGLWQDKRPPSQAEWQAAKHNKRKTVLDAAERQAFKRNLKALGLDGLPDGTLAEPLPEQDGQEPFDVFTGQA